MPFRLEWFSELPPILKYDCSLANDIYGRCPHEIEILNLQKHERSWTWHASKAHDRGLVIEDTIETISAPLLIDVLDEFHRRSFDIVSLTENHKRNIIEEDIPPDSLLILKSDCFLSASAYILSMKAADRLSSHVGPPVGAAIDQLCYLARHLALRVGYVTVATAAAASGNFTLARRRTDYNLAIAPGWVSQDMPAFHCAPPAPDPARAVTVQLATFPEYREFPPAPAAAAAGNGSLLRAYVNLEAYDPQDDPWAAQAHAVLSFRPFAGRARWIPLTYALGYEAQYRRHAGLPWAARTDRLHYWISHCVEERMALLAEMNRHLPAPTISLAACTAAGSPTGPGVPDCPAGREVLLGYNPEKYCAFRRARLALALENSRAEGYVTEKLWLPLLAGAVPVYHGAPDVARWLPAPEAVIDVASFPSVAAAMAYAARVGREPGLWERHTAWRRRPFGLRFLFALRNSLPNLFCNVDPALLL
jgi:hypothetical protein